MNELINFITAHHAKRLVQH